MTQLKSWGILFGSFFLLSAPASAQDWPFVGGAAGGTKYSSLAQVNRANVDGLEVAWQYSTGDLQRHPNVWQAFQSTPILVGGSLIVCSSSKRIVALDPATGKERWIFDANPPNPDSAAPRFSNCRGVSQWLDAKALANATCRHRILIATQDLQLIAIDSNDGSPCKGFGDKGTVRISPDEELKMPGELSFTSPPSVVNDVIVMGSSITDNLRKDAPSGKVRAFDARSGEPRWEFDPVPRAPDDPASATWGGDSNLSTGQANVWSIMSVDEDRDLIFLPTTSPSPDYYGGDRPGDNRRSDSLVALKGATGEIVWEFQTTHHDVWDYDLPAQPILVELPHHGEIVPAVMLVTKQGFTFVFNRETGQPLFPVEERPVPRGGVEGERLSATQPFPLVPPPLVRTSVTPQDAWGFTFVDRWYCRQLIKSYRHDGMYAPPSLQGTLMPVSSMGGANWGGGAVDIGRNILVVPTLHIPRTLTLIPRDQFNGPAFGGPGFDMSNPPKPWDPIIGLQLGAPFVVRTEFPLSIFDAPCTAPPWGRLSGIDLVDGTIKWQVALGSIENLTPVPIPWDLGTPSNGGPITTGGGLTFMAGTMDEKFRAFDTESGEELWEVDLPAGGQATPMTYESDGRQYVVIAAGGHPRYMTTPGDHVIAFALPR